MLLDLIRPSVDSIISDITNKVDLLREVGIRHQLHADRASERAAVAASEARDHQAQKDRAHTIADRFEALIK